MLSVIYLISQSFSIISKVLQVFESTDSAVAELVKVIHWWYQKWMKFTVIKYEIKIVSMDKPLISFTHFTFGLMYIAYGATRFFSESAPLFC